MTHTLAASPSSTSDPDRARLHREEELVRTHLPLLGYIVNETLSRAPRHIRRDDLMSAGLAALAFAARGYDESRGVPFARFANTRIRGALIDELRTHDWASRSVRAKARRRNQVHEQLVVALGREPSRQELAEALGVEVSELEAMDDDVQRAVVMSYQAVTETSSVEHALPSNGPTPEDVLLDREQLAYLRDAVAMLPERLRQVVVGYFFDERQMQEIADEMGVTCSRVSQMRAEALLLLRDAMQAHAEPEAVVAAEPATGRAAKRKAAYVAAVATRSDYRARLSVPSQRTAHAAAV